jgi:hypothetical protein
MGLWEKEALARGGLVGSCGPLTSFALVQPNPNQATVLGGTRLLRWGNRRRFGSPARKSSALPQALPFPFLFFHPLPPPPQPHICPPSFSFFRITTSLHPHHFNDHQSNPTLTTNRHPIRVVTNLLSHRQASKQASKQSKAHRQLTARSCHLSPAATASYSSRSFLPKTRSEDTKRKKLNFLRRLIPLFFPTPPIVITLPVSHAHLHLHLPPAPISYIISHFTTTHSSFLRCLPLLPSLAPTPSARFL